MWWMIGAYANLVVALAYLAIAVAIIVPLARGRQLGSNRLGTATAAIFVTSAIFHGGLTVQTLLPNIGLDTNDGLGLRQAFGWHLVASGALTAGVGVYYWTLRRTYSSMVHGAKLFDDLRERQRRALEINDDIVQGLVAAQLALRLGEQEQSEEALVATLAASRRIITDLLGETASEARLGPGDLRRRAPASLPAA